MKKDAFYFPHYSNARTDRKLKRVIKELGVEGYGIFFMVLEVLREQTDFKYPVEDLDLLADEFGTSEAKVRAVVTNYKLFDVDEQELFFSPKQILYLQPYIEKSQRARDAAKLRWDKVKCKSNANADANALEMQCSGNADQNASKVKESKGDKVNNIYNADNLDQRLQSFRESVLSYRTQFDDTMLKDFFEYWTEKSDRGYKMRFEKEKTWNLQKRLNRWSSNGFNKNQKPVCSVGLGRDF